MAEVYLRCEGGKEITDLPRVCIKCGAPATVRKSKLFMLPPRDDDPVATFLMHIFPLVNILIFVALIRRRRVETPFCDKHEDYWWNYPLLMWTLFFGMAGFALFAAMGTAAALKDANVEAEAADGLGRIVGIFLAAFELPIFLVIWWKNKRIRPTEITRRHICLTGVSPAFAAAVANKETHPT